MTNRITKQLRQKGIDMDLKAVDGYTPQYRDVNLVIETSFPGISGDEAKMLCEIPAALAAKVSLARQLVLC